MVGQVADPGTIPARAGSTLRPLAPAGVSWDHPRASGEHDALLRITQQRLGPSPRERGALLGAAEERVLARTIPARAGSTMTTPRRSARPRDHPRASGEHAQRTITGMMLPGPSPRERGAPLDPGCAWLWAGTIPARAGSTRARFDLQVHRTDHPRASGEHGSEAGAGGVLPGPSPRERGAPVPGPARPAGQRTIPARAGSTTVAWGCFAIAGDHPRASGEHL